MIFIQIYNIFEVLSHFMRLLFKLKKELYFLLHVMISLYIMTVSQEYTLKYIMIEKEV